MSAATPGNWTDPEPAGPEKLTLEPWMEKPVPLAAAEELGPPTGADPPETTQRGAGQAIAWAGVAAAISAAKTAARIRPKLRHDDGIEWICRSLSLSELFSTWCLSDRPISPLRPVQRPPPAIRPQPLQAADTHSPATRYWVSDEGSLGDAAS